MKTKLVLTLVLLAASPELSDVISPWLGLTSILGAITLGIFLLLQFIEFFVRPRAKIMRVGWVNGTLKQGDITQAWGWKFDQAPRWDSVDGELYLCGYSVPELVKMAKRKGRYFASDEDQFSGLTRSEVDSMPIAAGRHFQGRDII